jgi:OB-fold nucleic acid binding domain
VINSVGALLSLLVLAIIAWVKFLEGAWVIIALVPIMVYGLVRLNRAYEAEDAELHEDARSLATAPTLRQHTVVVFVDNLDAATARALQYARTLAADDLRAVHFDLDAWKSNLLTDDWRKLGFSRFPLDIIECPDRRVPRAALELAHDLVGDNDTELTILIPRREYRRLWHRLLHDHSSNSIVEALRDMPHCNVTIVPYQLGKVSAVPSTPLTPASTNGAARAGTAAKHVADHELPADRSRIADVASRQRTTVAGRVRSVRVQPWGGNPAVECTLADETGSVTVVFFGRDEVGGVRLGTVMSVTGVLGEHRGRHAMLNPEYQVLSTPAVPANPAHH